MKFPVELTINGREISAEIEPRLHLADFLREHLDLTATHLRCEQGACGACTLLIDGQPARSCITFAALCNGAKITTLEGLENDPVIAVLRRAFSDEHGLQCGYCTPGMLVTARDIILRLPNADDRRIREEISGNLCRCTGYVGIVRAIARALDENRKSPLAEVLHKHGPLGPVGARPGAAGKPKIRAGEYEQPTSRARCSERRNNSARPGWPTTQYRDPTGIHGRTATRRGLDLFYRYCSRGALSSGCQPDPAPIRRSGRGQNLRQTWANYHQFCRSGARHAR